MSFRCFLWNINLLSSHNLQQTTFINDYDFNFVGESEVAINFKSNSLQGCEWVFRLLFAITLKFYLISSFGSRYSFFIFYWDYFYPNNWIPAKTSCLAIGKTTNTSCTKGDSTWIKLEFLHVMSGYTAEQFAQGDWKLSPVRNSWRRLWSSSEESPAHVADGHSSSLRKRGDVERVWGDKAMLRILKHFGQKALILLPVTLVAYQSPPMYSSAFTHSLAKRSSSQTHSGVT